MDWRTPEYEGGEGPWLVLLHGLTGVWPIWIPVIRILEKKFRVLAINLPGHGGEPAPVHADDVTVERMADQIAAQLQARGIESAHFAGNSLGGWLALEMARRGIAKSVTALSPAGGWHTDREYLKVARPFRIIFALMPLLLFLLKPFLRFPGVRRAIMKQSLEHGERVPVDQFRYMLEAARNTVILPNLLRNMRGAGGIQPMDAPGVPVCVAWSERDRVIPYETYCPPIMNAVPGAYLTTVKCAGHVPMYDEPEQVAAIIEATAVDNEKAEQGVA